MKALALVPVLALAAVTFAAPPLAEAAHRNGRDGGRSGYDSRSSGTAQRYQRQDRGYTNRYSGRNRGSYTNRYSGRNRGSHSNRYSGRNRGYSNRYSGGYYYSAPYYDSGYYDDGYYDSGYYDSVPYYDSGNCGHVPPPPPPPRIYRHRRHQRPRVGIFFGF